MCEIYDPGIKRKQTGLQETLTIREPGGPHSKKLVLGIARTLLLRGNMPFRISAKLSLSNLKHCTWIEVCLLVSAMDDMCPEHLQMLCAQYYRVGIPSAAPNNRS